MNHEEFKQARQKLGLSISEMAAMLGVSADTVRKYESAPKSVRQMEISGPIVRHIKNYLDYGFRPPDWPKTED